MLNVVRLCPICGTAILNDVNHPRNYCEFFQLAETLRGLLYNQYRKPETERRWDILYNYVFKEISPKIRATGIGVEWHDPDTTYEEDVTAYINAVVDQAKQYKGLYE